MFGWSILDAIRDIAIKGFNMTQLLNMSRNISFYKFLPSLVVVSGLFWSASAGWFSYQFYEAKEQLRLESTSSEIVFHIKGRMATYEQALRGGVGFVKASKSINRDEWAMFVKEHKLSENFKGIQGFGYCEVVLPENKQKHEERIRKEGFADYAIKPEGKREIYTSIIYLEPFNERNKRAFGYDMYSEKVRAQAMLLAMQTGKTTLSGKVRLKQEYDKDIQAGFLMYLPIYKKNAKLETPQERVSQIQGFVYAPFRANDLMEGILGTMLTSMDFEIYDGNRTSKENILYSTHMHKEFQTVYKTMTISLNERTWTLVFKTNNFWQSENMYIIFLIPSFILIFTLLLTLLFNSLIKTKENALKIATKATQKLHASEERLRFSLEGSGDGLWDWNLVNNEVFFSKRWKEMLGFEDNEITSTLEEWKSRVHPQDLEQVYRDITVHMEGKSEFYKNEHRIKCKDGSFKWILDRGMIVSRNADGSPARMVGSHSDVSERKHVQLKLKEYMAIVDKNVISSTIDLHGNILEVSEAFCTVSGYSKNELLGKSLNSLRAEDIPQVICEELLATVRLGNIWQGEIKNRDKNGLDYWVDATITLVNNEEGDVIGYTTICHDITDKKRIEELSVTDKLTQLYNRLKLDEIFSMKLASARRYNTSFSIIMLDIDYFKLVNDTWGHQAGDDVLKEFATIIKNNIRETDIVGRWGGEEFLILSSDTDLEGATELSQKLRAAISSFKFSFIGHKTASFGVSSYHVGDDEKTMVKRADEALYRAKEKGRDSVEVEQTLA